MIKQLNNNYSVTATCAALGINHSNYQYFLTITQDLDDRKKMEDDLIRDAIENLINLPASSRYGYRPMTHQLKRDGFQINGKSVNHKRVLRIMRDNNLLCEIKKAFINTTDSNHNLKKYSNLLKKENINVTRLDQVWVSDITYIKLPTGFVYLAVIIDAYSRKVIGYCLSKNIDKDLALKALRMALRERRITNANNKLIHHSDQGVQYASKAYTDLLKFHGIRISMSRAGCPWENGVAESFFKTLKTNEVYLNDYQNIYEAKDNLFRFINKVYNQERLHSSLGYLPPCEFEELVKNSAVENINNINQTVTAAVLG